MYCSWAEMPSGPLDLFIFRSWRGDNMGIGYTLSRWKTEVEGRGGLYFEPLANFQKLDGLDERAHSVSLM